MSTNAHPMLGELAYCIAASNKVTF